MRNSTTHARLRICDTSDDSERTLLKVQQVAAILNVSRWFVYDHGEDLGLVKIGGANRYRLDRVEDYIARQLDEPAPVPSLITQSVAHELSSRDTRLVARAGVIRATDRSVGR